MTKKELRRICMDLRNGLTEMERLEYDAQIRRQLLTHLGSAKHVAVFLPIRKFKEIDLTPLLTNSQFHWYAPRTFFEDRRMEFIEIIDHQNIEISAYGIPEPQGENYLDPKGLDVIVIPMLVSDESGYRVGYGKGFYDNFLKRCRKDCLRIGVNYFTPVEKISDVEIHDEPIHVCISPDFI